MTVIIMILAALLLPVLGKARKKAREANCGSNLRQIGLAFRTYRDEHEGLLPTGVSVTAGGVREFFFMAGRLNPGYATNLHRIFQTLSNSLVNPNLLACPVERSFGITPAASFATLGASNVSYFSVVALPGRIDDSKAILAGDAARTNLVQESKYWDAGERYLVYQTWGRHGGQRGNLLFMDGRVESWGKESGGSFQPLIQVATQPPPSPPSAPPPSPNPPPPSPAASGGSAGAEAVGNSATRPPSGRRRDNPPSPPSSANVAGPAAESAGNSAPGFSRPGRRVERVRQLDEPAEENARFVVVTSSFLKIDAPPAAKPEEKPVEITELSEPLPMAAVTPAEFKPIQQRAVSFLWLYLLWAVVVLAAVMFLARFARRYALARRRLEEEAGMVDEDGED